ncbi:Aste57867_24093 [Aphanomyces stellatus]|uniref:Aste57867_24093 protein n=1 Tax=Aphanomyces stellatus TaxID=120398 RepID=A0A485LPD5_9STRA|nr:hypothetical protein As57867_024020 [Aphanomyces stellatus]VFU00735.1 Aste57867_24093 [Aphanomyces stellatus]
MNTHADVVDTEYLDLASHNMHAPSYQLSLQHSHSLDLTHSHYLDDGLQDEHYSINGQIVSPKNNAKPSLYKTELCKRFSEYGSCRYGAKCQFAHGMPELRHVLRHPKYKTTKCKSYWGSGHCPYGSRCRFIHEEEVYNPNVKNSFRGGITQENELSPTGQAGPSFLNSGYAPEFSPTSADMGAYNPDFNSLHGPSSPQSWLGAEGGRSNFIRPNGEMYPTKTNPIGPKKSPMAASQGDLDHGVEYSGLQDAIEVLMKFSQTYDEPAPSSSSSPKGSIAPTTSIKSPLARSDISLGADELWKDFSSVSISENPSSSDAAAASAPVGSPGPSEWFMGSDPAPQFDAMGNEIREDNSRLSFFTKFK